MHINRIRIRNFRNIADVDVEILPSTVIVGENRAGKSNFLYALRLVLDATLSYTDLQLGLEDFWDGLSDGSVDWDPMVAGETIEVVIDIVDFEDDPAVVAALGDALLKDDPMCARLTYRFAPIDDGDGESSGGAPQYRGEIFGGDGENRVPRDLRRYLHFEFLHALRDVESDIRNGRNSPLRRLLAVAAAAVPEDRLTEVKEAMAEANTVLNDLDEIQGLGESITSRLVDMVGDNQALETELAAAPDDPMRLIRGMRLFVDGEAHRNLGSASLGSLNVLYLALLELGLKSRLIDSEISHVVMAIEEPEAHLHPHLQRLIFRRILTGDEQDLSRTVLVTTQSPHIASVSDPRSLVVLRTVEGETTAAAAHTASLTEKRWEDIARYLDATRAELVFARRVLLVEGFTEQVLVPRLAQAIGFDLDKLGISVCAIHGTHFSSYAKFCEALDIPWAVITDGDPTVKNNVTGARRAELLMQDLGRSDDAVDNGIFVGDTTFEYDLITADEANVEPCLSTLLEIAGRAVQKDVASWNAEAPEGATFMDAIDRAGGKGRFAQRLALTTVQPPEYVAEALRYLERL